MHNGLGHGKCLVPSPISAALKSVIFLHPFSPLCASGNKDSDKEVCKKGHLSFSLGSSADPSDAHRKERVESNIVSIAVSVLPPPCFLRMLKERSPLHMYLVIKIFVWILNILQNPSSAQKLESKGQGRKKANGRWEKGRKGPRTTTEADLAGGPTLGLQTFTVVGNCGRMYFASVH